ncbi:MAG: hypothetical protein ACI4LP_07950 [Anaerovoracaceae bacterium]
MIRIKKRNNLKMRKAVILLGLVTVLSGLLGCTANPRDAEPVHDVSEVSMVSIGCGHMDYSCCYNFMLKRSTGEAAEAEKAGADSGWYFEGGCFLRNEDQRTDFEPTPVSSESAAKLLDIIEANNTIAYAENYKAPKKLKIFALDETTYSFCIEFSDGQQYIISEMVPEQNELEKYFYDLGKELCQ